VKVFLDRNDGRGPRDDCGGGFPPKKNLKKLDDNGAKNLPSLADPRTLQMNGRPRRARLLRRPFRFITSLGTIHSTETGAPTALMELAYRLAVDDSAYVKEIRDGMITLITSGGGKWTGRRSHGGHLQMASSTPRKDFLSRRWSIGENTWRTTNNRDAMGVNAEAHRKT